MGREHAGEDQRIMSAPAIGWIVFACVVGGALPGMLLRAVLPPLHRDADSKDLMNLGMGLMATMSANVIELDRATTATMGAALRGHD